MWSCEKDDARGIRRDIFGREEFDDQSRSRGASVPDIAVEGAYIEVSGGIERHARWRGHPSGNCADAAIPHPAYHAITAVGYIDVPGHVRCQPRGKRDLRESGCATVSRKARSSGTREHRQRTARGYLVNAVPIKVRNVKVARSIHCDIARRREFRVTPQDSPQARP